tara:strand:- start:275 stop:529 length:255 start_codon:yes stop_codon:yes gene_type:complete
MENNKHLVTCGDCGKVNKADNNAEEIKCRFCGYTSEPCDFPDYPLYMCLGDIKVLVSSLGWDYQRMSQSGKEVYMELCDLLDID